MSSGRSGQIKGEEALARLGRATFTDREAIEVRDARNIVGSAGDRLASVGVVREALGFAVTLSPEQEEALIKRVAERLAESHDNGFIDVKAAGEYLGGISAKAVYALVERGKIRAHRLGARLLFDPVELRKDVGPGR
jgi:hypothetical protein